MKEGNKYFLFLLCFLCAFTSSAAIFKTGEEEIISQPVNDNLYIAGGTITIDEIVKGDLMAVGGVITINDTIFEDLTVAGGDILINSYIGDDAKIFGKHISILKSINGDLIVCGAFIQIDKNVIINGDLIICGGVCVMNGTVNGNITFLGGRFSFNGIVMGDVDIKADKLKMNGAVKGNSILVSNTITLDQETEFYDNVEYWQKNGKVSFDPYMMIGLATYNEELELYAGEVNWKYFGLGIITFWILHVLSVWLTIILLVFLFSKTFTKAGELINHTYLRNFGYGMLYFIGVPLLAMFALVTVIGIPIGIVLFHLFLFSLLFAYSITSIVVAQGINVRYKKDWSKWKIIFVSAIIFPIMKLIVLIPFIGLLVIMVVIGMAFGTLVFFHFPGKKSTL